jgi:hypothetical protein
MTEPTAKELLAQADALMRRQQPPEDLPVLTELVRDFEGIDDPPQLTELIDDFDELIAVDVPFTPSRSPSPAPLAPQALSPSQVPAPPFAPSFNERIESSLYAAPAMPAAPMVARLDQSTVTTERDVLRAESDAAWATDRNASEKTSTFNDFSTSPTAWAQPTAVPVPMASAPPTVSAPADAGSLLTREQVNAMLAKRLEELKHSVYSQVMQQLELHATGKMKESLREALEPPLIHLAKDMAAQVAEEASLQLQEVIANAVENEINRLREQLTKKKDFP